MKKVIILSLLFVAFAANAQQKRAIGDYSKLNVKGSFDVTLVQGKTEATITATKKKYLSISRWKLTVTNSVSSWMKKAGEIRVKSKLNCLTRL
ncbi:hypothetical protein [Flavobacterium sp. 3HN19-14]|uniref:hypothetical protein n=1 Tax=Flavobacterium sp. 3HN19-14 TaxID=3448133 RepID=UPI003EDF459E